MKRKDNHRKYDFMEAVCCDGNGRFQLFKKPRLCIKDELERCPLSNSRFYLDISFVPSHDLFGKTQANAGSFLFSSEEWDEDLVQGVFFDSFSGV